MLTSINRVLNMPVREAAQLVELNAKALINLTGKLSTTPFVELKERGLPGFGCEVVQNRSVIGNVVRAKRHL